jgi:uncharacterized membrane protein YeaQ/YmgE (transglycosylase-associated protein family)
VFQLRGIILGILGSFIGGYLSGNMLEGGMVGAILTSAAGAAIVIFVARLLSLK